jgi:putative transposase
MKVHLRPIVCREILHPRRFRRVRVSQRSHSWMNRFRRILVRREKRAYTYVAMLDLSCALIT